MSGRELIAHDANEAFVSGLENLDGVVDILTSVKIENSLSPREANKTIKKLTPFVRQAYTNFTKALQHWEGEKNSTSAELEATVLEIGQTEYSLSQKRQNVEALNKKIQSLNDQIANDERELKNARDALSRTNDTYDDAVRELENKKRDQAIVAGVGAGISWIPIVGWIAGPTMIIVSLTALEDAVNNAKSNRDSAGEETRRCENRISEKKSQKNSTCEEHSRETTRKRGKEEELRHLEERKRNLEVEKKRCIELAEKVKNTCHFMTTLWGRSSVLKTEVDFGGYTLEPLFQPLKEVAGMFTYEEQIKIKVNTLLSKGIDYSTLSSKMKAICDKTQNKSLAILDDYI